MKSHFPNRVMRGETAPGGPHTIEAYTKKGLPQLEHGRARSLDLGRCTARYSSETKTLALFERTVELVVHSALICTVADHAAQ